MKKFIREDQGSEAGPNHAVHATCAALIWHEGLAEEALDIVISSLNGVNDIRPSTALQLVWKRSQTMRSIFPETDPDDEEEYNLSQSRINPYTSASLTSSFSPLTNMSVDNNPDSIPSTNENMSEQQVPPQRGPSLRKQFSLPTQSPILLPATLAAVRRARLLLSYYPATVRPYTHISKTMFPLSNSQSSSSSSSSSAAMLNRSRMSSISSHNLSR